MEKIDFFFLSLSFLTLKYVFSVTESDQNPYQATISIFVYLLEKSLGE